MLNKVMLIGNLGADPSVHETKAGDPVANFTLATNRRWKDADGERQAAASGYHELIELFLRSGTWTQIWITLRNATTLLAVDAPETALLVDLAATHDVGAPALDDDARAEADALRASLAESLGPDGVARMERRAAMASRPEVIREVMASLEAISLGE